MWVPYYALLWRVQSYNDIRFLYLFIIVFLPERERENTKYDWHCLRPTEISFTPIARNIYSLWFRKYTLAMKPFLFLRFRCVRLNPPPPPDRWEYFRFKLYLIIKYDLIFIRINTMNVNDREFYIVEYCFLICTWSDLVLINFQLTPILVNCKFFPNGFWTAKPIFVFTIILFWS